MKLHLYTIIPAALLVILQFIPVIRHKLLLFHRMNGYIVVILSLISNAGTIIITRHAFGGDFSTQTWTGAMVILTTLGYVMAWVNIKLLQIDQHRAWMLRTWAWVRFQHCLLVPLELTSVLQFSTIITIRIIMIISAQIICMSRSWYDYPPFLRPSILRLQHHTDSLTQVHHPHLRTNRLRIRRERNTSSLPAMPFLLQRQYSKPPCDRNRRLQQQQQHGTLRSPRHPFRRSRLASPTPPHLRHRMLREFAYTRLESESDIAT